MSNKKRVTSGAAPGIDAGFLNAVETALVGGGSIYFTSPYHIINVVAFTANQTQTFTATGVGGVPSGALAVLAGGNIGSPTAGTYANFAPQGGTVGQYFTFGNVPVNNGNANGFGFIPLNASNGQFIAKCNANSGTIDLWMYGYVI